jgi:molybdate transport system ATP-binding protein
MQNYSAETVVEGFNLEVKVNYKIILQSVNIKIKRGEVFIITGSSGSGKTTLAKIICGELKPTKGELFIHENMKPVMVSQQDHFITAAGLRTSYYGQRYENPNQEGIPTVIAYFKKAIHGFQENLLDEIIGELEIKHLLERKLLSLSNGERKRVQLAVALLQSPGLLILDQPFVGLDVHSREKLGQIIENLKNTGKTIVLVCDPAHIPAFADTILELDKETVTKLVSLEDYTSPVPKGEKEIDSSGNDFFSEMNGKKENYQFVVKLINGNVSFGGKHVLSDINWEVKPGEQWVLRGHNGAGKTTLLSLVTADNPQGYTNDLVLFDRKRGSGESIWDIKRKIGFVSPELHLYFLRQRGIYNPAQGTQESYNSLTCLDVVLSGFNDEVGFNTSCSERSLRLAKQWLKMLRMDHLEKSAFLHSSLGEQRIILLARALVKIPQLLILDEPCQGLDNLQTERFTGLLNLICENVNTTMIYVTHRAEEIPTCVSHFLELENGKVKGMGNFS